MDSTSTQQKTNIFKEIFGRVWALWGLITFVITFILFFIPSMGAFIFRDYKKGQEYFLAVARVWMRIWLTLIGCPLYVSGKENFKKGQSYIIVFNHNALLDVPLSAPFVPGANKTIAKDSFAKIPLFSIYYSRGSVLVNRKSEASRVKSVDDMKKVLAMGMHMCIYPEGTRNRTGMPMKPFYDGAFKLSTSTGNAIMPCVINGTSRAMPIIKSFYLWPTKLTMQFLPPVSPEGKTSTEIKNETFVKMQDRFLQNEGLL